MNNGHETLANMVCKYQDWCDNNNPHPKHNYCLDDQCPMNDYDNYKPSNRVEFSHCPKCGKNKLTIDITSPFFKCIDCKYSFQIYEHGVMKNMQEKQTNMTTEEYNAMMKSIQSPEHQEKVRKAVVDNLAKKEEKKFNFYMPIDNPSVNKMYKLIGWYEKEILMKIAFTIPTPESRELMHEIRGKLKHISCRECEHKNQFRQITRETKVFTRDKDYPKIKDRVVLIQEEKTTTRMVMSCLGCRTLGLKQIATGYIKGRRFKQI